MTCYGYARASSTDPDVVAQRASLRAAGCTKIVTEIASAKSRRRGAKLAALLAELQAGDSVVVTRLDRFGQSMSALQGVLSLLKSKDASLRAIEQGIDTRTPSGEALGDMLVLFLDFEVNARRERQVEGIKAAKARGAYMGGRPASIDVAKVSDLQAQGHGAAEIARRLGIGIASVYRLRAEGRLNADASSTPRSPLSSVQ
jgi:DNA invertase Pin-like site-specific DNA recombinase